jgi:diguanylate cyclase (GGDEF)-like protein
MSSTAPPDGDPTVFTPLADVVHGSHASSAEISEALSRDQAALQREVILWQRWMRQLAVLFFLLATLVFGAARRDVVLLPSIVVAGAYLACVLGTTWWVKRNPAGVRGLALPGLLVTADVATVTAFIYLSSATQVHYRMLLICLVVVQLSVFYFGWWLGAYAFLLTAVGYATIELGLPPLAPGLAPPATVTSLDIAILALVSAILLYVFGSLRQRMTQVRLFCKLIEAGELAGALSPLRATRPDDVTLLARGVDAMRNRLAEQIGTDPLTGCLNRRALELRLRNDWRLATRRGSPVAVLALDLDHFKRINDSHGHHAGDRLLEQIARIMKATARDTDSVARFGGDEFVILLPDTGWQGALTFAERLRHRVDESNFGNPTAPIAITISVGVVVARASDPISPEMLLREADRALYKAKAGGRNRVVS